MFFFIPRVYMKNMVGKKKSMFIGITNKINLLKNLN